MGHRTGSGSLLWARAQNLVPHYGYKAKNLIMDYGLQRRICFCVLGHSAKSPAAVSVQSPLAVTLTLVT
jgi:hypothetical protein